MKRKVIQLAGKTFVVSLPSKWARKLGVRKGDELDVEELGNSLVISVSQEIGVEKAILDARKMDDRILVWALSSLQKSGYDEIELLYDAPHAVRLAHEVVRDLFVGFAVTEQGSNRCVIRSISRELESEFDSILRRAFLVTLSMGESLHEALKSGRLSELNDVLLLEKTNNQLTNFCERILVRKGYRQYRKTCFSYVVVWNLEKLADNYKYIILHILSQKKPAIGEQLISLLAQCNSFLRSYYELYYRFDHVRLNALYLQKAELDAKARGIISTEDPIVVSILFSHITQISDLSASLIALNL